MLTVLVASSKGGCGKSTLVTQLASHWAQQGKRTAIVDADRQGSSYRWAGLRPEACPACSVWKAAARRCTSCRRTPT